MKTPLCFSLARWFYLSLLLLLSLISSPSQAISITGTSSGTFNTPTGPSGMVVTGLGSNQITWGLPVGSSALNSLSYTGASINGVTDSYFNAGFLNYFNGVSVPGTEINNINLLLSFSFTAPAGLTGSFNIPLNILSTPNVNADPNLNADTLSFSTNNFSQTLLLGSIDYTLSLQLGSLMTAGGFILQDGFSVLEGESASLSLRGMLTQVNHVPEPSVSALLLIGFMVLISQSLRRKHWSNV